MNEIKEAMEIGEKLDKTFKEKNVKNPEMFRAALIVWDVWKLSGHKNPSGALDYIRGETRKYILNAFFEEIQKNLGKSPKTVISDKVKELFGDYTHEDHHKFQKLKWILQSAEKPMWEWLKA